jgi:hypothetical protein
MQKARSWFWSPSFVGAPRLRPFKHGNSRFDPRLWHYLLSIFLYVLNCYGRDQGIPKAWLNKRGSSLPKLESLAKKCITKRRIYGQLLSTENL